MAISYPLSLPTTVGIRAISLRQVNAVALSQSPFTYKQQAISHVGQRWEADISLVPMKATLAREWIAWLSSLKGYRGTFTMGDYSGATAQGEAGGTPIVAGASQTGSTLDIDGATTTQTGWLKAGDYIQLGTGATATLHMNLTDADTVAGATTLDLWPDIRTAPADNAAVTVANTVGLWRLNANQVSWDVNSASIYGLNFTAVEAIV